MVYKAFGEPVREADSWQCLQRFSSQWVIFLPPWYDPDMGTFLKLDFEPHCLSQSSHFPLGWMSINSWFHKQAQPLPCVWVCVCVCVCVCARARARGRREVAKKRRQKEKENLNLVWKQGEEKDYCQVGLSWLERPSISQYLSWDFRDKQLLGGLCWLICFILF